MAICWVWELCGSSLCANFGFTNHLALIACIIFYNKWVQREKCPFQGHLPWYLLLYRNALKRLRAKYGKVSLGDTTVDMVGSLISMSPMQTCQQSHPRKVYFVQHLMPEQYIVHDQWSFWAVKLWKYLFENFRCTNCIVGICFLESLNMIMGW